MFIINENSDFSSLNYGGSRIMVSTEDCGSSNAGSIPAYRPFNGDKK